MSALRPDQQSKLPRRQFLFSPEPLFQAHFPSQIYQRSTSSLAFACNADGASRGAFPDHELPLAPRSDQRCNVTLSHPYMSAARSHLPVYLTVLARSIPAYWSHSLFWPKPLGQRKSVSYRSSLSGFILDRPSVALRYPCCYCGLCLCSGTSGGANASALQRSFGGHRAYHFFHLALCCSPFRRLWRCLALFLRFSATFLSIESSCAEFMDFQTDHLPDLLPRQLFLESQVSGLLGLNYLMSYLNSYRSSSVSQTEFLELLQSTEQDGSQFLYRLRAIAVWVQFLACREIRLYWIDFCSAAHQPNERVYQMRETDSVDSVQNGSTRVDFIYRSCLY